MPKSFNETMVNVWFSREDKPQVADIFVKKGPFLKLYTSYIKDFSEATEIMDEACKKYPSFLTAVKQFEVSRYTLLSNVLDALHCLESRS